MLDSSRPTFGASLGAALPELRRLSIQANAREAAEHRARVAFDTTERPQFTHHATQVAMVNVNLDMLAWRIEQVAKKLVEGRYNAQ